MAIKVLKPGLATTVQDLGRPGYYNIGIPLSGGMDRLATRAANMLVGNDEGAAVLEAVFMGPELEFTADATVAVTGAELPPKVDGNAARRLDLLRGEEGPGALLRFPQERCARLYRGLGRHRCAGRSRLAFDLCAGRAWRLQGPQARSGRRTAGRQGQRRQGRPHDRRRLCGGTPGNPAELRMVPGLYWHRITEAAGQHFFEDTWKVAPEADRIGYRFKGGTAARIRAAHPAFRCRLRSLQHRRCLLSLWLDPDSRAAPSRSCCIAMRCRAAAISWSGP